MHEPATTSNETVSRRVKLMLGLSLHAWENLMVGSLAAAAFVAFLVVVSTWAVVHLQRQELAASKDEFERYKLESGEKIAAANLETMRLRVQLDQEVQKRAPRVLTNEQRAAIVSELKGKLRTVVLVVQNDPEADFFSVQLMTVLSEAGVELRRAEPPREDKWNAPAGLVMYSPLGSNEDDLKDDPLYRALKAANLFGGTTNKPYLSPQLRPPPQALISGYSGHVLYVGQKSPF